MFKYFNYRTHPGQPKAVKLLLGGPLQCRGPPTTHLAAFCCPGFVMESNAYNISASESQVAYLSLAGSTSYLLP